MPLWEKGYVIIYHQPNQTNKPTALFPSPTWWDVEAQYLHLGRSRTHSAASEKSNPRADSRADQGVSTTSRWPRWWRCKKIWLDKALSWKMYRKQTPCFTELTSFSSLVFLYACGLQIIWLKSLKISPRRNLPFLITQVTGKWSPPPRQQNAKVRSTAKGIDDYLFNQKNQDHHQFGSPSSMH